MANPLLLAGGAVALLYFMTRKSSAPAAQTATPVLPPAGTGTTVSLPIPGGNGEQATVTVSPNGAVTVPGFNIPSPMVDGAGWVLSDDGSNSLAIKGPDGTAYSVTRLQVLKKPDGGVIVQVRPDLQVVNPKVIYTTTQATPAGTTPQASASQTTPAATATQVAAAAATAVLPGLATQIQQAANVLSNQAQTVLTPPTAVQVQETMPAIDTHGSVALAGKLINAESTKSWKTAFASDVAAWQKLMGLIADGKFGPKSALAMGAEVGVLPLIRYYSSTGGSKAQQVAAFKTALGALASAVYAKNPALSVALRSSQDYEQGQGYVTAPAAIPATARVAQAAKLNAALQAG